MGPLFGPRALIWARGPNYFWKFWFLGPLGSKFGRRAQILGPLFGPAAWARARAQFWGHFWAWGPKTKKLRAEKPCRIPGSEFQMGAYAPSYGQKPFWGQGPGTRDKGPGTRTREPGTRDQGQGPGPGTRTRTRDQGQGPWGPWDKGPWGPWDKGPWVVSLAEAKFFKVCRIMNRNGHVGVWGVQSNWELASFRAVPS